MRFFNFLSSNSSLIKNARDGNLDRVRDILRKGVDVNARSKYGNAALFWASNNGHVEVVRALLNHEGVDVNIKDNDGGTALIAASMEGHFEVVRVLLNHEGVEVNVTDNDDCAALIVASYNGHLEVVRALLSHEGVDVNIKGNSGGTALIMASMVGHLEVVRALLNHEGLDANARDKYGYTALDIASSGVARILEEHMERENLLVVDNPSGRGSKFRVTRYPSRPNVNISSSDDAEIGEDQHKLLRGMSGTSAEPVGLTSKYITSCRSSDVRKKRNAEEMLSPCEEDNWNRKMDAELKQMMEEKRRGQEWFRTAGIGAVQRLTADPGRGNDNALHTMTPTYETSFSK